MQITKDFGVPPDARPCWMKIADKEDGVKSGTGRYEDAWRMACVRTEVLGARALVI